MIAICEFCGKEYKTYKNWYNRPGHHTCSRKCAGELKKKESTKLCKYCGKEFYSHSHQNTKLYCSRKCARTASRINIKGKICPVCKTLYYVLDGGFYEKRTCSVECSHKLKSLLGTTKYTCVICHKEYIRTNFQTKRGPSRFCSKKCQGIGLTGANHPSYKGTKKAERDQLKEWSKLVKRRDCYTCQECGSKKHLHAHHIKERSKYKELKLDINNGITLCHDCHAEKHKDDIYIYNLIINSK